MRANASSAHDDHTVEIRFKETNKIKAQRAHLVEPRKKYTAAKMKKKINRHKQTGKYVEYLLASLMFVVYLKSAK